MLRKLKLRERILKLQLKQRKILLNKYWLRILPSNNIIATQPVLSGQQEIVQETSSLSSSEELENENHIVVKSPIIGTFYRKPSPDKPSFVEVGKSISEGDVLCVIEAMKLFNEIESEFSGKIVKILAEDQSPVEFDQPLFIIDPS